MSSCYILWHLLTCRSFLINRPFNGKQKRNELTSGFIVYLLKLSEGNGFWYEKIPGIKTHHERSLPKSVPWNNTTHRKTAKFLRNSHMHFCVTHWTRIAFKMEGRGEMWDLGLKKVLDWKKWVLWGSYWGLPSVASAYLLRANGIYVAGCWLSSKHETSARAIFSMFEAFLKTTKSLVLLA